MTSRVYHLASLFVVSSVFLAGNDGMYIKAEIESVELDSSSLSKGEDYLISNFNTTVAERNVERTFIMVKPDGVQRGLIGDIVHRFEKRGYKMVAGKMMTATEALLRVHYAAIQNFPFFGHLLKLFSSGPVFAMVWEGKDIVKQGRAMLFGDDHLNPKPGTIRGDYSIEISRNVCHGSDSVEVANEEIELWFKTEEIVNYKLCTEQYLHLMLSVYTHLV